MIRSELKYLIGAKIVNLKCRVFGGKTGPMAMVQVFGVVRPVATVRFRVEPYPEPTREFGPVANTNRDRIKGVIKEHIHGLIRILNVCGVKDVRTWDLFDDIIFLDLVTTSHV